MEEPPLATSEALSAAEDEPPLATARSGRDHSFVREHLRIHRGDGKLEARWQLEFLAKGDPAVFTEALLGTVANHNPDDMPSANDPRFYICLRPHSRMWAEHKDALVIEMFRRPGLSGEAIGEVRLETPCIFSSAPGIESSVAGHVPSVAASKSLAGFEYRSESGFGSQFSVFSFRFSDC
jgi:hypothetical protein